MIFSNKFPVLTLSICGEVTGDVIVTGGRSGIAESACIFANLERKSWF